MQLRYIDVGALIAAAGGDPWAINKSLQAGRPAQIADLAEAFHAAGVCTTEAQAAFEEARRRFQGAWNHENGDHPINDSAEVQRVTAALGAQSLQLPKIAVDLEGIAAALAEAQRSASGQIATLESQLQKLDDLIGQAVEMEKDAHLSADDRAALNALIDACEHDAIEDTKTALAQLQSIRNGYSDGLNKSLSNLRSEGYDLAALHGVDSDEAPPPSRSQTDQLREIRQITDQAVLDQMAKVRAAQEAIDKAMATVYTRGPGSAEGEAAAQSLPKLKEDLARALDDLGKIPDYTGIDPASVSVTPDGHFIFNRTVNGQQVQVSGQLKNGTGEFFDQATGTYYTFKDGRLAGMRTPDPGRVEATAEPLFTAITLAVGAPELKAGGEAAWQGLKALFARAGGSGLEGLTSENVLARAMTAAEIRAQIAAADPLRPPPGTGGSPVLGTHPGMPPVVEPHPPAGSAAGIPVDHPPAAGVPDSPPPVVPSSGHPVFNLDNPLDYMTPELQALSEQHLTGSGETVLGPFNHPQGGPSYIDLAKQRGASYFDIGDAWNSFAPTQQLAANQHVLDIAIANGDTIKLTIPVDTVLKDTYTYAEITYLRAHGYEVIDGYTLAPPRFGGHP